LGKIKFSHDSELKYIGVPRLMLVIVVFAFALYMIPGLFGAPLKAISSLLPPPSEQHFGIGQSGSSVTMPSNLCETPEYSDFLHQSNGLQGYFDLKQGISCAKKLNKPVFLDIKGHTCSNCKEMEAFVFSDEQVLNKLRSDFVLITLYVDDPLRLPENKWVTSDYDGKTYKTMGSVNLDYEISTFKTNTQPLYAILNSDGKLISPPYEFNTDVNAFLKFLDAGKGNVAGK
jgi:thiol:disulfide interchange protein DsbD